MHMYIVHALWEPYCQSHCTPLGSPPDPGIRAEQTIPRDLAQTSSVAIPGDEAADAFLNGGCSVREVDPILEQRRLGPSGLVVAIRHRQ
ncbi:hypothetical protein ACCAA_580028 [Candidatus Accumulibacter aalborgensis]|uniref:Uncharacterized protein n=1 Tax=Candidatus Accumulibacter aalborgensis TaxID=1860102 RepID=A0A1A8XU07_9PROT|nr:hypothetical protein ACCAA_580028 [Candidatus Accumulibacter aalborgensis]